MPAPSVQIIHSFTQSHLQMQQDSPAAEAPRQLEQFGALCGFEQKEAQYCRFSGYELHYALYNKFPS